MLEFHLPRVRILSTNHCGNLRLTAFTCTELCQDVLCCRDYADIIFAIFAYQIQSECYSGNISVSIESIALENFSAFTKGRHQFNYTIT